MECEKENVKMWKKKVRRRRKKMNSFKILPLSLLILSLFFLLWKERKKEKRKKWKAKRKKGPPGSKREDRLYFSQGVRKEKKKKELQILKNREEIGIAFLESRKNVKEKGSINEKKCRTKSDKSRKKKWLFVSSFFSLYLFLFSLFSSKKRKWL